MKTFVKFLNILAFAFGITLMFEAITGGYSSPLIGLGITIGLCVCAITASNLLFLRDNYWGPKKSGKNEELGL